MKLASARLETLGFPKLDFTKPSNSIAIKAVLEKCPELTAPINDMSFLHYTVDKQLSRLPSHWKKVDQQRDSVVKNINETYTELQKLLPTSKTQEQTTSHSQNYSYNIV